MDPVADWNLKKKKRRGRSILKRYLLYVSEIYAFSILRPLQSAITKRGDRVAWFLEDPKRAGRYLRPHERRLKSVAEVKSWNPEAVFVPGNLVPDFFPGIKVELFHGFNARKRPDNQGHFRIRNFFDLYCTQGPDTTVPFQELETKYGFFEVIETGWPKMDPLFWNSTRPLPTRTQKPVILLTSTFTPKLSAAPALFDSVRRLAQKGRWKWLVHFHPKMDPEVVFAFQSLQGQEVEFVETDDLIPLLLAADVMVSDTSSIVSEFLLQIKPVVTYRNRMPGPHLIDIQHPEELEEAIQYGLTKPPHLISEIVKYVNHIHPYRDGCSSLRVLSAADSLIARGRKHLRPKPLNLWRRARMRKRLGYYRL